MSIAKGISGSGRFEDFTPLRLMKAGSSTTHNKRSNSACGPAVGSKSLGPTFKDPRRIFR